MTRKTNPENPEPPAPGPGHSSIGGIAADRLKSFAARIERLKDEKSTLGADIREVCKEAKDAGFDVKVLRRAIGLRKQDKAERAAAAMILETYLRALGDFADTELGRAGMTAARAGESPRAP